MEADDDPHKPCVFVELVVDELINPLVSCVTAPNDLLRKDLRVTLVEYRCIMDVFTVSSLSAQVRVICVNSLKGRVALSESLYKVTL